MHSVSAYLPDPQEIIAFKMLSKNSIVSYFNETQNRVRFDLVDNFYETPVYILAKTIVILV